MRTRDLAVTDLDGYHFYRGRTDDLIGSAGFRIGPAEIEDCLVAHPAMADSGFIGISDPARGQIVKAFVLLKAKYPGSDAFRHELQPHARHRLGGYEVPRAIEFVADLPITTLGKVSRREYPNGEID